jgi:hypothetical protein
MVISVSRTTLVYNKGAVNFVDSISAAALNLGTLCAQIATDRTAASETNATVTTDVSTLLTACQALYTALNAGSTTLDMDPSVISNQDQYKRMIDAFENCWIQLGLTT